MGFSGKFVKLSVGLAFTSVMRGMKSMPFRLFNVIGYGLTEQGPGCPSAESLFRFPAGNRKEMGLVKMGVVPPSVNRIYNPAVHRSNKCLTWFNMAESMVVGHDFWNGSLLVCKSNTVLGDVLEGHSSSCLLLSPGYLDHCIP